MSMTHAEIAEITETKTRPPFRPELTARQSAQVHALAGYIGISAPDFVRAAVDNAIMLWHQNDPVAAALLTAINAMN
jgi:hypothetical protein